jgi:hypothetical protein
MGRGLFKMPGRDGVWRLLRQITSYGSYGSVRRIAPGQKYRVVTHTFTVHAAAPHYKGVASIAIPSIAIK